MCHAVGELGGLNLALAQDSKGTRTPMAKAEKYVYSFGPSGTDGDATMKELCWAAKGPTWPK